MFYDPFCRSKEAGNSYFIVTYTFYNVAINTDDIKTIKSCKHHHVELYSEMTASQMLGFVYNQRGVVFTKKIRVPQV